MLLYCLSVIMSIFPTGYTQILGVTHLYEVLHQFIIVLFLFFCPGLVFVRFFKLREPVVRWVLTLALSLTIDAMLAGIFLYAGWWSPVGIFSTLEGLCLAGVIVQFVLVPENFANLKKLVPKPLDRTGAE